MLAVKSLTSLCLSVGKPPVGQLSGCSTVKDAPHGTCTPVGKVGGLPAITQAQSISEVPLCGSAFSHEESSFSFPDPLLALLCRQFWH